MIVIDTLVHNFLHRTGIHRRFEADHLYGDGCYAPGGCADILEELANRIDARAFPSGFPRLLPALCPARNLAVLCRWLMGHLQWQPDRRPHSMREQSMSGLPGL